MENLTENRFDLLVIGSGPAGQRAAIQGAKLGKQVAIVERMTDVGGGSIHTGTIPSKTLRESILYLTGYQQRGFYGPSYRVKEKVTLADLSLRAEQVVANEEGVARHQLERNGVRIFSGHASFVDSHTLSVTGGHTGQTIAADRVVIAVGSKATKDERIPFDGETVLTSDELHELKAIPRSMAVIGGGIIGCEYACMAAELGVQVTLVDRRDQLLAVVDREISSTLQQHMQEAGIVLRLGEDLHDVHVTDDQEERRVRVRLSGGEIVVENLLYAIGRTGATAGLNLDATGLAADGRGHLPVNEKYQTDVPHIYAAGDVIGNPGLAATSMEQGRLATCHAFDVPVTAADRSLPFGIYTIPEISMVGATEDELSKAGVPYETGRAHYREIARGQILADYRGLLKLLFHAETRELLGTHVIGAGATELVHIGQAVMHLGGGLGYLLDTVFNYPTLAECYKTAALDAANRLQGSIRRAEPQLSGSTGSPNRRRL